MLLKLFDMHTWSDRHSKDLGRTGVATLALFK